MTSDESLWTLSDLGSGLTSGISKGKQSMVRAKFYVSEVKQSRNHYGSQEGELLTTIKLVPVTGTSNENKAFFRWTPSGTIDLGTVNPAVVANFHIGDEFYVDFTPAKTRDDNPA